MKIMIKKLTQDVKLPSYAHPGDAGMDLYSNESHTLQPGERHEFALGFAIGLPAGNVSLIWDKSGLSFKHGLHCLGGVIDAGYRGEYKIMLVNLSNEAYKIEKGDKIAQLLIQPVAQADIEVVQELSDTSRGIGSFGSTGRN